jgi:hypothetical protein
LGAQPVPVITGDRLEHPEGWESVIQVDRPHAVCAKSLS